MDKMDSDSENLVTVDHLYYFSTGKWISLGHDSYVYCNK